MAVSAALPPPAAPAFRCAPCAGCIAGWQRGRGGPRAAGAAKARPAPPPTPPPQPLPQGKTLKDVFEAFCSFGAGGGPVAGLEGRMFSK